MATEENLAESWWQLIEGSLLNQGDLLNDCYIPVLLPNFNPVEGEIADLDLEVRSIIILTQSCDLENKKAPLVAVCPVYTLPEWEDANPNFRVKGQWESVRQGRTEGLHLLAGLAGPITNRDCLAVDFRQIYSLPVGYLEAQAEQAGRRARLQSPYLEHFAQAFARFFMRVGLPSNIAKFN